MDLPYRTVEVDVSSITSPSFGKVLTNDTQSPCPLTSDGVRIDKWNGPNDISFLPYLNMMKDTTSTASDASNDYKSITNDVDSAVDVSKDFTDDEFFEAVESRPPTPAKPTPTTTPAPSPLRKPPPPKKPKKRRTKLRPYLQRIIRSNFE